MSESLLEKYPHLKLLTKLRKPPILPLPGDEAEDRSSLGKENPVGSGVPPPPSSGRISLLGPGVRPRTPLVQITSTLDQGLIPRTKVAADDLFAASIAADDDEWLQFQVDNNVPAKQQLDQLKMWLMSNSPSTVTRSSGIGWIAVKFRDKGKKVLEAKAAWDAMEEEKTMEIVNNLAEQFSVKGGKWMCHLPTGVIDQVWGKLATTMMCGGLGPSVYMVKVSPKQDIQPELSRGEHVICVYNTDYKDTEQVMRVENLMRSAGVATNLTYKPDIFSALGIYRNNKWGFRPTIYHSRVMMMEGRSKVEVVGTSRWYYNSSKGLQHPPEKKEASVVRRQGEFPSEDVRLKSKEEEAPAVKVGALVKEVQCVRSGAHDAEPSQKDVDFVDASKDQNMGEVKCFSMENMDDLKHLSKEKQISSQEKEENLNMCKKKESISSMFDMREMEAMKESNESKLKVDKDLKKEAEGCKVPGRVHKSNVEVDFNDFQSELKSKSEVAGSGVVGIVKVDIEENNNAQDVLEDQQTSTCSKKPENLKPAWLLKLQQLKLRNLDELSKPD